MARLRVFERLKPQFFASTNHENLTKLTRKYVVTQCRDNTPYYSRVILYILRYCMKPMSKCIKLYRFQSRISKNIPRIQLYKFLIANLYTANICCCMYVCIYFSVFVLLPCWQIKDEYNFKHFSNATDSRML